MVLVIQPGLLTTVQDRGRSGYGRYGVMEGGAMDSFSCRVANLLVGNPEGEAVLEITLMGPTLRFDSDTGLALCGGEFDATLEGRPVRGWSPARVRAGGTLKIGSAVSGCRCYLAVTGGFDLPKVMGSRSTDLRSGVGGFQGRSLRTGDALKIRPHSGGGLPTHDGGVFDTSTSPFVQPDWSVGTEVRPGFDPSPTLRAVRGSEFEDFTPVSRDTLFSSPFRISPRSDRMGYRLDGPPIRLARAREYFSEAVTAGTVQVTPEGQPILLLADAPPTGGYPKVAQVVRADLLVLAQCKPGDTLRFEEVTVEEARRLFLERERQLRLIREGIRLHGNRNRRT